MIRLSDLRDTKVKSLDGKTIGRVHEVHSERGRIVALTCGPGSWLESLTAKSGGRRIPWERVVKISKGHIVVAPDAPQRRAKSGGSRTRPGTRRPTGQPSKR